MDSSTTNQIHAITASSRSGLETSPSSASTRVSDIAYVDPYVVVADNEILETKYIAENSALISKLKVKRDSMHSAHLELQANPQQLIPKDHDRLATE